MAYGVDFVSRRQYDIHFMDLTTGETLSKVIHNSTGSLTWSKDGSHVFYATKDPDTLRVDRIWRDELKGDKPPVCVYHEQDEAFSCGIGKQQIKGLFDHQYKRHRCIGVPCFSERQPHGGTLFALDRVRPVWSTGCRTAMIIGW